MNWVLMGVVLVAGVVLTIVGVALLGATGLGALAVVALAVLGLLIDARLARRKAGAGSDEHSALPRTHIEGRDGRPLGDSPDLHDEIDPHDIPLENPARREIERSRRAS